jgi:hypothetical protein
MSDNLADAPLALGIAVIRARLRNSAEKFDCLGDLLFQCLDDVSVGHAVYVQGEVRVVLVGRGPNGAK